MPVRDPRFGAAVAITEAITGQSMGEDDLDPEAMRKAGKDEVRVVFPMDAWDELEYLADDSNDDPTDLPSKVYSAWEKEHGHFPTGEEDISCEGEEEDTEWAFYCRGFTTQQLLPIVEEAIPDGWTAGVVPVPEEVLSGGQIAITRR
jgi:hypothetical protein